MKTVLLLSGGMDSSAALGLIRYQSKPDDSIIALSFDYGQKHGRSELIAAQWVVTDLNASKNRCDHAWIEHRIISLNETLAEAIFGGSSLTGSGEIPEGHYADETMKQTVVPNRNMILLSLATAIAMKEGAEQVVYGAHAGDHAIYPDCRTEFAAAMKDAILQASEDRITLYAPFVDMTKAQIVETAFTVGVPLFLTWSCYKGGEKHCGRCGTCVERIEAFGLARDSKGDPIEDSTVYLDRDFARKEISK